jgi:hypothetical protein
VNEERNADPACALQFQSTRTYYRTYSNTPAAIPTTARAIAALPLCFIAPPVAEALGVLLDPVLVDEDEAGLPSLELALAAAWNAAKLLAAVGLTAKTIPCSQCLKPIFHQYKKRIVRSMRNLPSLTAIEPQGSTGIRHGEAPLREGCGTRGNWHKARVNTRGRRGHVLAWRCESGLGDRVVLGCAARISSADHHIGNKFEFKTHNWNAIVSPTEAFTLATKA